MIRYDPVDMAEIRVYFQRRFLCRAICPELSEVVVSRAEIIAARRERRVRERGQVRERRAVVRRFRLKDPAELEGFAGEEDDGMFPVDKEKKKTDGLKRYEHE